MASDRVLIIGGGLAGTALAIALAHSAIPSTIVEIRSEPGTLGGGLMLMPNALRVLDKVIGIYEDVRSTGFVFENVGIYMEDGMKVGEVALGDVQHTGYPAVRIERSKLHAKLLEFCGTFPELIRIDYGRSLSRIEEDEYGVVAYFEDGSSQGGRILIGCDGIHSKVRKHVLGSKAPIPTFSGLCGVGGTLSKSQVNAPSGFTYPAFIYTRLGLVLAIPKDPAGQEIGWAVHQTTYERTREGWKEYGDCGEAAQQAKKGYQHIQAEPIRSMMTNFDPSTVRIWPPYEIPDLPTWHTPRVCLLGDAAHAIPPSGGQGAAQAFEDAGFMARLLTSPEAVGKGYDKLFGHFERIRKARFEYIRGITAKSGSTRTQSTSGLAWFGKKWLMWVYFWWKGGILRDLRVTKYDVAEETINF